MILRLYLFLILILFKRYVYWKKGSSRTKHLNQDFQPPNEVKYCIGNNHGKLDAGKLILICT